MQSDALFNEARLLLHWLKRWADAVDESAPLTPAMRGVLERLLLGGPATVPDIARTRGVSRQHIQQQVDVLLERGLVGRQQNPAHKRSPLIDLEDKGRALIQDMRAAELDALARLQVGVSDNATAEAAQVLSAWRAALARDLESRTP